MHHDPPPFSHAPDSLRRTRAAVQGPGHVDGEVRRDCESLSSRRSPRMTLQRYPHLKWMLTAGYDRHVSDMMAAPRFISAVMYYVIAVSRSGFA